MPTIEIDAGNIQWPARCCRCGSKDFSYRPHADKVVVWTVLSVTAYRQISLNIPVCNRCSVAHYYWFGAALSATGIGFAILQLTKGPNNVSNLVPGFWFLAIALGIIGTRKTPIKILKFNEEKNRLTIKIFNKEVAALMRRLSNRSK